LMKLRPGDQNRLLHVLSNLSRQPGLRQRVIETMDAHGVPRARTEIRSCGWLAQADDHGGSIFAYRPYSKGALDMALLVGEVLELLGIGTVTEPASTSERIPQAIPEPASMAITSPVNPN